MLGHPKTLVQAKKCRYGAWAGNPEGNPFHADRCAYEVYPVAGWVPYQCLRKPGCGPGKLYCKQHAQKL